MEKLCNGHESESAVVFEVIGEPAIVINGVPHLTPRCTAPIHEDAISDAEADSDPCLGEWLEGRKVQKMFGTQLYSGKVVKYDSETKWYQVVYEDGDLEDLEWHELEELLLPLDISVPLIALALQRCRSERSVSESGLHVTKSNRSRSRSIESMDKKPICQITWERQKENTKTALQMAGCEISGSRPTKALVLFQRPGTDEIKEANLSRGATEQEISKRPRDIQSWRTARAEKQKRLEKPK